MKREEQTGAQSDYQAWRDGLEAEAQARRQAALARLATADDVRVWAAELRAWFRQVVGQLPLPAQPAAPELTGTIERDGYRIEKWLFETMPGTWTSSNLYIPDRPHPGGVAMCAPLGHWTQGKAQTDYQQMAGFMALHGIPVLVYDHAGVGERREFINPVSGLSAVGKSPTDEHNHTGALATLAGIPPCRLFLAEAAQASAFLASFPFVDRSRIGFSGASGGGTISAFAGAYLEDVAFSIPVCIIADDGVSGSGDAEQQCPDSGVRGVALVDLLAALVPRPAMIIREKGFALTERSWAMLHRLYGLAGASQAAAYAPIEDVHGYTHPMVEAAYAFLAGNFSLPRLDITAWTRVRLLDEHATWCTPAGCLLRDRPQVTVQEQVARLAPRPSGLTRERLAQLLGIADLARSPAPPSFAGEASGRVPVAGAHSALPGALGLLDWPELPADYYGPGQSALYRSTAAGESRRLPAFGRSLLGLRVRQILDFAADHRGRIAEFAASGEWSLPLALACALAPAADLPRATVRDLPLRHRDQLSARLGTASLSACVPGLLAAGDTEDILALCGGRLRVEGFADAEGRAVAAVW